MAFSKYDQTAQTPSDFGKGLRGGKTHALAPQQESGGAGGGVSWVGSSRSPSLNTFADRQGSYDRFILSRVSVFEHFCTFCVDFL